MKKKVSRIREEDSLPVPIPKYMQLLKMDLRLISLLVAPSVLILLSVAVKTANPRITGL